MNGEDPRKENGGAESVGEEYRSENRYSVHFTPDNAPASGMKDEGEGAGEMERPDGRKTREELESKYRNDPRFSMLFDHGHKNARHVWQIRVAGIRLTPKRILILCGFLFIILLCLGACFFYVFQDISKLRNYAQAKALYEAGDYAEAKEMLFKVLSEDPNKEDAVAVMAEIYKHYGDWANEAFFRQRMLRLNPLNEEYFLDYLKTSFRARNFNSIYLLLNLKVMDNPELSPEEGALYLVSALLSGHVAEGKAFHESRKRGDQNYFSSTETGRFAEFLLDSAKMDNEQVQNRIASLEDIQDSQVRFETINVLLHYFSTMDDAESEKTMEKLLLEAAALNDYAGAPMLANFYFARSRFEETIEICNEYLKTKMNAFMPILFGESCALNGQAELIPPLAERIHRLRGRQSKMLASYLDALTAFCSDDDALLRTSLMEAGSTIKTPLSSLMKFHLAIKTDSPKEILITLGGIMKGSPFMDFQERARTTAMCYLMEKLANGSPDAETFQDYAGIASLIQTSNEELSFLPRIILQDRRNRGLLKEDELLDALGKFPNDFVLLRIAAEYYILNGQPERAMDFISAYNGLKDVPDQSSVALLHVLALDMLDRKAEAEKEFRSILQSDGGGSLLYPYYSFCIENGLTDALKSLSSWIEAQPKDSAVKSVLPFVRAEILLADDATKDQAFGLFEKCDADDPRFIFHAASRLAKAGRRDAALKRYLSIRNTYPDKALVNINLSELYFGQGEKDAALECARTAWQEDRSSLLSRYIYGKRLFELGEYAEVVDVLGFPQYKASFPEDMIKLWEKAIRERLKADFDAGRYGLAQEKAKHLLIYFPDDKSAQDYLEKIETLRRQERNRNRQQPN